MTGASNEIPRRDVIFALSFDTWADATARGMFMPTDRLAAALLDHPSVGKLLIAQPFRSLPIRLVRRLVGEAPEALPSRHDDQVLWTPLRLRRRDPVSIAALGRAYRRYDELLRRRASRLGMDRPAVITASPWVAGFAPLRWAGAVTYYAFDDWASYPRDRRWWAAYEEAYARVRELGRATCAVSQSILDRIAPRGPSLLVPNGLAVEEWQPPWTPPAWFQSLDRPRLVYIGSLDGRLDTDRVLETAKRFPEGSVVIVGFILDRDALAPLEGVGNIHIAPGVSRKEVAGLLHEADVCLLPHRRTPLTEAMSPLKLYEYLAAGRPVVTTDLPPVRGIDPRVVIVPEEESFADGVERALAQGPATEGERQAFVSANSWALRQDAILRLALR